MGEVDEAYVQPADPRPTVVSTVPVIDLSLCGEPDGMRKVVAEIGDACENWGFFQVINHGVPAETRERVEKVMKQFFGLSMEEKRKVKRDEVNLMGYHDSEYTMNIRDWKEVFDFYLQDPTAVPPSQDPNDKGPIMFLTNQWPLQPPDFREACEEYAKEVEKLSFRLLGLISLSLGLPEEKLHGFFKEQTSVLRLNHYPPCPQPEIAHGIGRHTDGGALTVLAQDDVGGLQVNRRSDGVWIPVYPIPNGFIINIGDCVQVWTNDKYWSAEHRVLNNTEKERFSIPLFFFPAHHVNIEPLEELLMSDQNNNNNMPKYKPFNWGNYYVARNRSTYKKLEIDNYLQKDIFKVSSA